MDPNATYLAWLHTEDTEEALEHAENLLGWLNRGGFPPEGFDARERAELEQWCRENRHD